MTRALPLAIGLIISTDAALAADRTEKVAGWTITDTGSKAPNDLNRSLEMKRVAPGIEIVYRRGIGGSAAVSVKLEGCNSSSSFSSSTQLRGAPEKRAAQVKDDIKGMIGEFAQACPFKDRGDAKAMEGFDQAFRTIEDWVKAKPFVEPKTPPADNRDRPRSEETI